MMIKINKLFLLVFLCGTVYFTNSQTAVQSAEPPATPLRRVIDPDGWQVPDIKLSKVSNTFERKIESVLVQSSEYAPIKQLDETISFFSLYPDGNLRQSKKYVEIRSFKTLKFEGTIFAYELTTTQVGLSKVAGRAYFGPIIIIVLIDEDGDGIFETRIYDPTESGLNEVPSWVIKKSSSN